MYGAESYFLVEVAKHRADVPCLLVFMCAIVFRNSREMWHSHPFHTHTHTKEERVRVCTNYIPGSETKRKREAAMVVVR